MYLVNRAIMLVRLKQPFVDWINSIEKPHGKLTVESVNRESHVYLIPEHDTPQELELIIQDLYPDIFKTELASFDRSRRHWPKTRDYQTFLSWFDIEVHSMVFDPYDDEIEKEEFIGY